MSDGKFEVRARCKFLGDAQGDVTFNEATMLNQKWGYEGNKVETNYCARNKWRCKLTFKERTT